MTARAAARLGDPIGHTPTGLRDAFTAVGMAIGLAVAVRLGGATASMAGAFIAAKAMKGFGKLGQMLGTAISGSSRVRQGDILRGTASVVVEGREAARAHASNTVGCHRGASVAVGSSTVHYELSPASRVGDDTTCGGEILAGARSVFVGGGFAGQNGQAVLTRPKESDTRTFVSVTLDAVGLVRKTPSDFVGWVKLGYDTYRFLGGGKIDSLDRVLRLTGALPREGAQARAEEIGARGDAAAQANAQAGSGDPRPR